MYWTEEQTELLKKLHKQGLSNSAIARRVSSIGPSKSRNACIGKVHRLGIEHNTTLEKVQRRTEERQFRKRRKRRYAGAPQIPERMHPTAPPLENEPKPKRYALTALQAEQRGTDELKDNQCRWPHGDEDFEFCGHTKVPGSPYCTFHSELSYVPKRGRTPKPKPHPASYTPSQSDIKEFEDA